MHSKNTKNEVTKNESKPWVFADSLGITPLIPNFYSKTPAVERDIRNEQLLQQQMGGMQPVVFKEVITIEEERRQGPSTFTKILIVFILFSVFFATVFISVDPFGENEDQAQGTQAPTVDPNIDLAALCATRPNENAGSICLDEQVFARCLLGEVEVDAVGEIILFRCEDRVFEDVVIGGCECEKGVVLGDSQPCAGDNSNGIDNCDLSEA
eukprot:snap_masked-scaffold_14-processed-gene-9.13-mRNA-1 protein AED:1.00 eAED:1.00 QI:0/0/0/0/1/1/2/0/210